MKQQYITKILIFTLFILLALFNMCNINVFASNKSIDIIETRTDFMRALDKATDGDILYVGDIDFGLSGTGAIKEYERINISKNITIKGAYDDKSVLSYVSFNLDGTLINGKQTKFSFENIIFDGNIEKTLINYNDWELTYDLDGNPISYDPLKTQYAVQFFGMTNASFKFCEFKNYMSIQGGAIKAYYGVYGGDNMNYSCHLDVTFDNCKFYDNATKYAGGAIYLDGNGKNIRLSLNNTIFENNVNGLSQHIMGGGAIYAKDAIVNLNGCTFNHNESSYIYVDTPDVGSYLMKDVSSGGALFFDNVDAEAINTNFIGNISSNGGAIFMRGNTQFDIDGCIFTNNMAIPTDGNPESADGISSDKGIGGAIYINNPNSGYLTITNSSIYNNIAENVSGAIYDKYYLSSTKTSLITLNFCTIVNNICNTKMEEYSHYGEEMWIWFNYPGDFYEIPYVKTNGCLIVDDLFEKDFVKNQLPSEDNNYNYLTSTNIAILNNIYNIDENNINHLYVNHNTNYDLIVPVDFLNTVYKGKYTKYFGTFFIGSNAYNMGIKIFQSSNDNSYEEINYIYNQRLELPIGKKEHYNFLGWQTEDETLIKNKELILISPNITTFNLIGSWEPVYYKISFDSNGGSSVENIIAEYNSTITLSIPTKEGFKFIGWYLNNDKFESNVIISDNITLVAKWEELPNISTIILIGGVSLSIVVLITILTIIIIIKHKKKNIQIVNDTIIIPTSIHQKPDISNLTDREKQVLNLLLEGKKRSEIAIILFVSEETIKKQITSIYSKLCVSSRSELFAKFR